MFGDVIQTIVAGSALFLGLIYLLGGLIINLHLTKFGLVDYQILQVKYLVTGLVYIPYVLGMAALAFILGFALLALNFNAMQALAALSVLASVGLFLVWAFKPTTRVKNRAKNSPKNKSGDQRSFLMGWNFWIFAGTLTLIFPVTVIFRQWVLSSSGVYSALEILEAVLIGVLALLAQVYHYAAFYYGYAHFGGAGVRDPIGIGIPHRVELAIDPENAPLLADMGLSIGASGKTEPVTFLDETDAHYIIIFDQPGSQQGPRLLKITKGMVKAILYHDWN